MRFFRFSGVLFVLAASGIAQADESFTMNNTLTTSWFIAAESNPSIGLTGSGHPNPTLTLAIGMRYDVTDTNFSQHPFQIIAEGPTDTVLLSLGGTVGSLESDPGINWTDNNSGLVAFTLTQNLVDHMTNVGLSEVPGYRCGVHTMTMRGLINVVPEPSTLAMLSTLAVGGLLWWRRRS